MSCTKTLARKTVDDDWMIVPSSTSSTSQVNIEIFEILIIGLGNLRQIQDHASPRSIRILSEAFTDLYLFILTHSTGILDQIHDLTDEIISELPTNLQLKFINRFAVGQRADDSDCNKQTQ